MYSYTVWARDMPQDVIVWPLHGYTHICPYDIVYESSMSYKYIKCPWRHLTIWYMRSINVCLHIFGAKYARRTWLSDHYMRVHTCTSGILWADFSIAKQDINRPPRHTVQCWTYSIQCIHAYWSAGYAGMTWIFDHYMLIHTCAYGRLRRWSFKREKNMNRPWWHM